MHPQGAGRIRNAAEAATATLGAKSFLGRLGERLESPEGRLVVLGSAGLAEGFSLIGAEVYPDADDATVERVLAELARTGAAALVLLESGLAHGGGVWLNRLRNEGGRIVVTELPALAAPQDYAPAVDELVRSVLGSDALR